MGKWDTLRAPFDISNKMQCLVDLLLLCSCSEGRLQELADTLWQIHKLKVHEKPLLGQSLTDER